MGILFIAMVFANHALFKSGYITARQAIGYEMLFVIPGLIASFMQLLYVIKSLLKKNWQQALLCVISAAIFWVCMSYGISQGAAIVYAT